jgi:hypothetical protein
MAETEALSDDERMKNWQFVKACIDYRSGLLKKGEAVNRMSFFSGLLPSICEAMLRELNKVKVQELHHGSMVISFPKGFRLQRQQQAKKPANARRQPEPRQ